MGKNLIAFKEAGKVFLLSRVIILFLTYVSIYRFPFEGLVARNSSHLADSLTSWYYWDAKAYIYVAQHGYSDVLYTAFFPLWPLLERIVGSVFGAFFPVWPFLERNVGPVFGTSFWPYYVAGLLLSNSFFYCALVLLYKVISDEFEETIAKIVLFFLAFNAYGLFFFAGFTESLFLLLCVAVFYCLRRENPWYWWLAGLLGMLAMLTRSAGIALAVPFFVLAAQRFWRMKKDSETNWLQKIHMFLPIILIPIGLLIYMLYLKRTTGNPFMFSVKETQDWHRHLSLPWVGIVASFHKLLSIPQDQIGNVQDLLFTLLPIGVLIAGWKRLPWHYSLFAVALMLPSLMYPIDLSLPLASVPRYMIVVFPVYVILAIWAKRQSIDRMYLALSLPMFALNIALFVNRYWVG